jgi:CheY-like chemotaxis protein
MRLNEATVLVVDDEKDLREIFGAWLGRQGCRVLTAANGTEALEVLSREKIDVLVSDIRMPIMGGVALVRSIYERKLLIPSIIFVSGYGDVEPREMYGLGVELLMEKPLTRGDLIHALEQSVMGREELWQTPSALPMTHTLERKMASLAAAITSCEFQLGRGGCCFATNTTLEEETTIGFAIDFVEDGLCLRAEGTVRWHEQEEGRTGVSFDYLDPGCRGWLIELMRKAAYRSFIPQCRCEGGGAEKTR